MPRQSEARAAAQSFFPEALLVEAENCDALAYKYEAQGPDRFGERLYTLADRRAYGKYSLCTELENADTADFGGLCLETGTSSPITGTDRERNITISVGETRVMALHVEKVRGPQHIRGQLGHVASYIAEHDTLRERPYVVGVSYREMARLGIAMGMRKLYIEDINLFYESQIRAKHSTSFARNGHERKFEVAAVYLSTDEFVARFTTGILGGI